jgi:hypothetical protein
MPTDDCFVRLDAGRAGGSYRLIRATSCHPSSVTVREWRGGELLPERPAMQGSELNALGRGDEIRLLVREFKANHQQLLEPAGQWARQGFQVGPAQGGTDYVGNPDNPFGPRRLAHLLKNLGFVARPGIHIYLENGRSGFRSGSPGTAAYGPCFADQLAQELGYRSVPSLAALLRREETGQSVGWRPLQPQPQVYRVGDRTMVWSGPHGPAAWTPAQDACRIDDDERHGWPRQDPSWSDEQKAWFYAGLW